MLTEAMSHGHVVARDIRATLPTAASSRPKAFGLRPALAPRRAIPSVRSSLEPGTTLSAHKAGHRATTRARLSSAVATFARSLHGPQETT